MMSGYQFREKFVAYRRQARYQNHRISCEILANLLNYKLKPDKLYKQQYISRWETDETFLPDPALFLAVLELLTFHGGFKRYEEAADLIGEYQQIAKLAYPHAPLLVFDKADFDDWRRIQQTIFDHLPQHILRLLGNVIRMGDMVERATNRLLDQTRAVSFEGQGGMGKTSAAVQVALELGATGIFEGIYFVGVRQGFLNEDGEHRWVGETILHLDDALNQLALQMGIAVSDTTPETEKLALITDYYHKHVVLVILDNLETYEDVDEFADFIQKLTLGNTRSRLIITSRKNLDTLSTYIEQFQPRELAPEHAQAMLQKRGCDASLEEVTRLHAEIGGNPLALWLFSVLIKRFSIDDLLTKLAQTKSEWDKTDKDFKRHNNLFDYLYERILEIVGDNARELCWDLGMNFMMERGVKRDKIREKLRHLTNSALDAGLSDLIDVYLVYYDQTCKIYSMHRLIIHYIRKHFLQCQEDNTYAQHN